MGTSIEQPATWLRTLARASYEFILQLLEREIAHHLLIADGGRRLYVVARRLQGHFDSTRINVAGNEAVGHFIAPNLEEFEAFSAKIAREMLLRWRLDDSELPSI